MNRRRERIKLFGYWHAELQTPGGQVLWRDHVHNDLTDEALNDLLSSYFAGGTQKTAWYAGLIANNAFAAIAAADTMASHAGWAEATPYSNGTRPQWTPLSSVGGVIANTIPMSFSVSQDATLRGMFLTSGSAKGGTSGVLWNRGLFVSPRVVQAGTIFTLTYSLRVAGGA